MSKTTFLSEVPPEWAYEETADGRTILTERGAAWLNERGIDVSCADITVQDDDE